MRKEAGDRSWLRHVAAALGYAVSIALLHQVSFSHWVLFAGFRLCALLFIPYRYWPALAVGEMGPLAYTSITCLDQFGLTWALVAAVPPIAVAMPAVYWCRKRLRLFPSPSTVKMGVLLLCMFSVAVIWTICNLSSLAVTRLPPDYPALHWDVQASRWFIGNFLGVLTVTPLAVWIRECLAVTPKGARLAQFIESRLLLEGVSTLLPTLALLVWLSFQAGSETARQAARMAMFLPVIWVALRHGWQGAAIGGTAASIAVVLTMPARYDAGTLQAQVFIAFAITSMLLLGARISVLNKRDHKEREDLRMALAIAQRNIYVGEMQLRQASQTVEQIRESVKVGYNHLISRIRHTVPVVDERSYMRQAAIAQEQLFRLSDSLYPAIWRERGLPAALREGSIARGLAEVGISYDCDIGGRGLSRLSPSVHIALYRLACECIVLICSKRKASDIRLRIRGGQFGGRWWVVLSVESHASTERAALARSDDLMVRLACSGMGYDAIQHRAQAFEGTARRRVLADGERVSLILYDPTEP
ncbi:MASE1 domain-containing protein [Dyella sp. 20L07]|uniref:MASE1 domain-containing protein n=1 Tax=Dyella sp. 20L07 TaxID=3384240 RepID=UPI003D2E1393